MTERALIALASASEVAIHERSDPNIVRKGGRRVATGRVGSHTLPPHPERQQNTVNYRDFETFYKSIGLTFNEKRDGGGA